MVLRPGTSQEAFQLCSVIGLSFSNPDQGKNFDWSLHVWIIYSNKHVTRLEPELGRQVISKWLDVYFIQQQVRADKATLLEDI